MISPSILVQHLVIFIYTKLPFGHVKMVEHENLLHVSWISLGLQICSQPSVSKWILKGHIAECGHTYDIFTGHTSVVASLLCWEEFWDTRPNDKVWACTESGTI